MSDLSKPIIDTLDMDCIRVYALAKDEASLPLQLKTLVLVSK